MDKNEFEKQITACKNALERFVYFKTPSKTDGDDVLQETLLAAFKHHNEVKNEGCFKAWLLRIATNKCNDFYRDRSKMDALSFEDIPEIALSKSRYGLTIKQAVHQTLEQLGHGAEILQLFFLHGLSQTEISKRLRIPIGTVKSRIFNAKQRFKKAYQFAPKTKGEFIMKKLPNILPHYTITKSPKKTFEVKWEELPGWFIKPKSEEKALFGFYDLPDKKLTGTYTLKSIGKTSVHGVEGLEIEAQYCDANKKPNHKDLQVFAAQLSDTHCRWLSETHYDGDVKHFSTFLDADEFLTNWGFGEDNCGMETSLKQKGIIKRDGNIITTKASSFLFDIVGRNIVFINEKTYDCVCIIEIDTRNKGIALEFFVDKNGRLVLARRYNSDSWRIEQYGQRWSEKLPDSNQLIINGEVFVCWYECVSDYVF